MAEVSIHIFTPLAEERLSVKEGLWGTLKSKPIYISRSPDRSGKLKKEEIEPKGT
jgi:hypothetical protein